MRGRPADLGKTMGSLSCNKETEENFFLGNLSLLVLLVLSHHEPFLDRHSSSPFEARKRRHRILIITLLARTR